MARWLLIVLGLLSIAVAVVSFPVPGFPSSLFLLLGLAALARSLPGFEQRLRESRLLGLWIRRVEGLPRNRQILFLVLWLLSLGIGYWLTTTYIL